MNYISNLIIPLLVLFIIVYGYIKKVNIYDTFIDGVKESFPMIKTLFPTYLAMILAVNLFINSGFLDLVLSLISDSKILPKDIIPLAIVRPISGSASLAYLNNIYTKFGPDSYIGLLASVIQGCTDTTLYVIGLYYGSIGIKNIKHTLKSAFFADFIGILASIIVVKMLFT